MSLCVCLKMVLDLSRIKDLTQSSLVFNKRPFLRHGWYWTHDTKACNVQKPHHIYITLRIIIQLDALVETNKSFKNHEKRDKLVGFPST